MATLGVKEIAKSLLVAWNGYRVGGKILLRRILGFFRDFSRYAEILDAKSIARRMFVTNSFDGLLSSLGVILGAYIAGLDDPLAYYASVTGASVAMGVFSGIIATYFSERAERLRELKEIEKVVLHDLRGSVYEKAAKLTPIYVALWSGTGVVLLPLLGASPFIIAAVLGVKTGIGVLVYASISLIIAEMFMLGVYLGSIAGESKLLSGLRLAGIGGAAATLFTVAKLVLGLG